MKNLIYTLMLSMCVGAVSAQVIQDEDALALINTLEEKYNAYQSLEAQFSLTINIPEEEAIVQSGMVIQRGQNYFLDTESQAVYSDGKSVWVHVKDDAEVQINDIDEDEGSLMNLSPSGILSMFDKDKYEYAIVKKESSLNQIELKPMDRDSDISKVRIEINIKSEELTNATVFYKDGIRSHVNVSDVTANKSYNDSIFKFDATKFPGIYVEDLRID